MGGGGGKLPPPPPSGYASDDMVIVLIAKTLKNCGFIRRFIYEVSETSAWSFILVSNIDSVLKMLLQIENLWISSVGDFGPDAFGNLATGLSKMPKLCCLALRKPGDVFLDRICFGTSLPDYKVTETWCRITLKMNISKIPIKLFLLHPVYLRGKWYHVTCIFVYISFSPSHA